MTGPNAVEARPRPCWVAGRAEQGESELVVRHPFDGTEVASVAVPGAEQVERAVAAAAEVAGEFRRSPAHLRAAALEHVSRRLAERAEEIAETITAENGKPLRWAAVEVERAVSTFRFAAEEARRFTGDLQRLDTDPAAHGRLAVVRRVSRGPVLGIAPFNFPLNLVAHKVAPALAVGSPIVVKPAPRTPLSALLLGELLAETDLPAGAFSVLPLGNEETMALVRDERLPVVSFTGSGPVGWSIADAVPRKHVVLELGGNAAAVVCADWDSDADLDFAARRIATYSNYQAGQSCIAVQRVVVDRAVADRFVPRLVEAVRGLRTGDPHDPEVVVGPLVDEDAAKRVETWIGEATARGARVLAGGTRTGTVLEPTVLADVPTGSKAWDEEIFGPVLAVSTVDGLDEALALVNDSRYGLQAGVFTHDVRVAFRASAELEVGGVIVGDVPSYRADQMPYGGVKGSGVGREGVRSAMNDLTEERVLVLTGVSL
ncbi:Acyl-CoA reductase [Streptoalloteichus tenebrarius]|uniref:Acyl-CoA reductase n=1 Tax=Streptoalloteichus tenebrarius (strain ATCC 17920 / DSM 40477 / JCM 4838 / CBS 697.72 / NBRC 16177 / NCIMB 11028 / NRRL B-12390 / A12253. 1 / ISP 5477) TaxID=1933 RepID=A0ABT1HXQ6_STRSD|nr:aldehyde dehydrogenase family protein [Streptoalloteichus tenebrarius]MCP2260165.1 Acyl-CoA reductase [Streptoalloteichus tenebrarius]BFF02628.1 aldehyde dehydrogenase family protein [Streptoalloteichus tenebrarius]